MIARLTGQIVEIAEDSVLLDRDGVGYEVLVPHYAVGELAACLGRQVTLHTLQFFEGNQTGGHLTPMLLGFVHPEDKTFFRRFISVKGIGMRKALKALAEPVGRVASWIEEGDRRSLTRLPGIGQRAAELIIAELKGKVADLALTAGTRRGETVQLTDAQRDALEMMMTWGDPRADAERWLQRAAQLHPDAKGADEWLRMAYRIKSGVEG